MAGLTGVSKPDVVPGGLSVAPTQTPVDPVPAPAPAAPRPGPVQRSPLGPNGPRIRQGGPQPIPGPQSAPAAPAPPAMTNTSSPNPTINTVNEAQLKAFNGDMNAGRASQLAAGQIRDSAEGELKAMRGGAARRGVSGGGLEANQEGDIRGNTLRNIAGSSANIAMDAEMRRNALGGQIVGQAATEENLQNQQRNTAIRQVESQSATRLAEERGQREATRERMAMFEDLKSISDEEAAMAPPTGGGFSGGVGAFGRGPGW